MSTLETVTEQASGLEYYRAAIRSKILLVVFLLLALVLLTLASLGLGAARIGMSDMAAVLTGRLAHPDATSGAHILLAIRLPRVLLGIVGGMGLAVSGAVMQAVLRNPMASSYTLGVSSAAGFGATLAIGLGWGVWGGKYLLVANAFLFGMMSMGLVYGIARIKGAGPSTLILAGIAVSYFFSALVALVKYIVSHDVLAGIVYWLMGGLNLASWDHLFVLAPLVTAPALLLVFKYAWDLNLSLIHI